MTRSSPPSAPQHRDAGAMRPSELVPVLSRKIRIWRSRALVPLLATALTCVLLFSIRKTNPGQADLIRYMQVTATFLVFAMFMGLYFYVGERKHSLWYMVPATVTVLQLVFLLEPYFYVFRKLLPGDMEATSFATAFTGMFFGAGLMEELLKAIPIMMALGIALALRRSPGGGGVLGRGLALQGPVDGLLMGAAAGGAFILVETLLMYVPSEIRSGGSRSFGNESRALLAALTLMVPRVLNGVVGHMAYAGIFGYFIGLAVTHPGWTTRLFVIGWLLSSVLHAFWNSASWLLGAWGLYVSAGLTLFVFLCFVLKAKQLEVSRLGGPVDGNSILAISTPAPPSAPAGVVPPAAPGVAGLFTGLAGMLERAAGVTATTTVPNPGATPSTPGIPETGLSIGAGGVRYALAPNAPIDFSALFREAGVPPGFTGVVVGDGSLDIANTGVGIWSAAGPDGSSATLGPGGRLKVSPGTRLLMGDATVDIQAY